MYSSTLIEPNTTSIEKRIFHEKTAPISYTEMHDFQCIKFETNAKAT